MLTYVNKYVEYGYTAILSVWSETIKNEMLLSKIHFGIFNICCIIGPAVRALISSILYILS